MMKPTLYSDQFQLMSENRLDLPKSNPWKGISFFLGILLMLITVGHLITVIMYQNNHIASSSCLSSYSSLDQTCSIDNNDRFDCDPNPNSTQQQCESLGCCWKSSSKKSNPSGSFKNVPLGEPYCFFPNNYVGYSVSKTNIQDSSYDLILQRQSKSSFVDVQTVTIHVTENVNSVDFVTETNQSKDLKLPKNLRKRPQATNTKATTKNYYTTLKDGVFSIYRSNNDALIWSANLQTMIFADGFRQLDTKVPVQGLYGLGERMDSFYKTNFQYNRYTFFNRDRVPYWNLNLYGTQPIYLMIEQDGQAHQVINSNEYASEAILRPGPAITWRTLGGDFKFHIEIASDPLSAITQTGKTLGTTEMPPVWALGFQLCRYGYNSLNETRATYQRMRDAQIPYDVQWNDIDYMDGYNDFTYDPVAFDGLPDFVDELHKNDMHYVIMLDPGLDGTYINGNKYTNYTVDTVIQNPDGSALRGKVWNKNWTAWVDFTGPVGFNFWINQVLDFYKQIPFDGVWIDMNDPSNEVFGSLDGCINNNLDRPIYLPGDDLDPIYKFTACMSAKHFKGTHFDYHNSYNLFESHATNQALRTLNKRPFIISRSTFVSSGSFTGHWTGDVVSTFEYLQQSVVGILDFNLFSIPMVGADICGFNGNTTVELCARWQQVGAFYPFSRNHNTNDALPQDPPSLGEVVVNATRNALLLRYRLHNLLYTLFYEASAYGSPVIRSMFTLAPTDPVARTVQTQFLWGDSLLVIPVLEEATETVLAYFTPGYWYDFQTYSLLSDSTINGVYMPLSAPIDTIRLAVRGGSILTLQKPEVTIPATRRNPLEFVAFLDQNGQASGNLFWDDGETLDTIVGNNHKLFALTANQTSFNLKSLDDNQVALPLKATATIVNVQQQPTTVFVNNDSASFTFDKSQLIITISDNHASDSDLTITWN